YAKLLIKLQPEYPKDNLLTRSIKKRSSLEIDDADITSIKNEIIGLLRDFQTLELALNIDKSLADCYNVFIKDLNTLFDTLDTFHNKKNRSLINFYTAEESIARNWLTVIKNIEEVVSSRYKDFKDPYGNQETIPWPKVMEKIQDFLARTIGICHRINLFLNIE
ncbi:MAG: hypothetical protein L0207_05985, partial [Chlamydiae bacterium]|nr:hypothetical protein [Chlamydiota bacterium]